MLLRIGGDSFLDFFYSKPTDSVGFFGGADWAKGCPRFVISNAQARSCL